MPSAAPAAPAPPRCPGTRICIRWSATPPCWTPCPGCWRNGWTASPVRTHFSTWPGRIPSAPAATICPPRPKTSSTRCRRCAPPMRWAARCLWALAARRSTGEWRVNSAPIPPLSRRPATEWQSSAPGRWPALSVKPWVLPASGRGCFRCTAPTTGQTPWSQPPSANCWPGSARL